MSKKLKAVKATTTQQTIVRNSSKPIAPAKETSRKLPPKMTKDTVRQNTKQAQIIDMLRQSDGMTIEQMMDLTGWQQHSVHGFMSGVIKKKLGLKLTTNKNKKGIRTYHVKAA